jgi:K+-transporting ATPase A subunit
MEDMKAIRRPSRWARSQEAIKMIGTNGGGFFNANSAHPYENPTALSNLLQMLAIFLIPAALVLCLRARSGRHPPGLGRAGGHDGHIRAGGDGHHPG